MFCRGGFWCVVCGVWWRGLKDLYWRRDGVGWDAMDGMGFGGGVDVLGRGR